MSPDKDNLSQYVRDLGENAAEIIEGRLSKLGLYLRWCMSVKGDSALDKIDDIELVVDELNFCIRVLRAMKKEFRNFE